MLKWQSSNKRIFIESQCNILCGEGTNNHDGGVSTAFLIIKASDESARKILGKWMKGVDRGDIANQFIRDLGNGTYLTEPSGEILALAWGLRKRYENKVDIFVADLLTENEIPYKVREVTECLMENPDSKKALNQVKDIQMKCTVSSNEISLDSFERKKVLDPFAIKQKN